MSKWVHIVIGFKAPDDFTWDGCPSRPDLFDYANRLMDGEGLCHQVPIDFPKEEPDDSDTMCSIEHSAGGSISEYDGEHGYELLCDKCGDDVTEELTHR